MQTFSKFFSGTAGVFMAIALLPCVWCWLLVQYVYLLVGHSF